jgi:filamentous hemagglutinin family protein
MHRKHVLVVPCLLALGLSFALSAPFSASLAQTITSSGLNTSVSAPIALPSGQTQFDIMGGTRPGGGTNLFHSFGNFNVPNSNIANFLNDAALPTSNILGRVNGGNVSNIFGTIQTTGFGNANLFLMNPAGFLFGPNATVNVGGMVSFTSADYLRLADGARFNAIPNASADALLSAAPVAAFGFLGSNPGAITVQGSQLTVAEGTGVSFVGGDITVEGGALTAPSGQINLVSVGKPSNPKVAGEVVIAGSGQGTGFSPTGFRTLGTVSLSQSSVIDVPVFAPNSPTGSVVIRGGQIVMEEATVTASGLHAGALPSSVTLESRGSLDIRNSGLFAFNLANGGTVDLRAGASITLTDTGVNAGAPLGDGGSITMAAPIISLSGGVFQVNTGEGRGGTISLSATKSVSLSNSILSADSISAGGTILINGGNLFTAQQSIVTAQGAINGGGTIQVRANRIRLTDTTLNAFGDKNGGNITLDAQNSQIANSQILSTGSRQGGTITITSPRFQQDASSVIDASSEVGTNGTVTINGVIQP